MGAPDLGFVHRFEPAAAPGRPTLLLLHGTGGDETGLLPLGRSLAPSAALLSPRGKVSEGGAARFFRRLAEGVFDLDDLRARAAELAGFVGAAAAAYEFDPAAVVAVGYSNGANIAAALLLLHPGVLAGAALLHPMVPLVPEEPPDLTGTPVFVGAGRRDPLVPAAETERLVALLRGYGADLALAWHDGGHGLDEPELRAAAAWLDGIAPASPALPPSSGR